MNTLGLILLYGSLLVFVIAMVFLVLRVRKIAKLVVLDGINPKNERNAILFLGLIFTVFFTSFFIGAAIAQNMALNIGEWLFVIFGGLGLGASIVAFYVSFRLHYYQKNIAPKLDKTLYWTMLGSIITIVIFGILLSEGFAAHINYPLSNGISWDNGIHLTNATNAKPNIAWYAFCILFGAIFVYFLSDHQLYKKYGKHGLLESTFYVAFPAGVIGARVAYVIGNWSQEFSSNHFNTLGDQLIGIIDIHGGGLTILGGAIAGIVVGVLWFKWRHPDIDVITVADIAVPTILLAQAAGRWGNFFNCEVHGGQVSVEYWRWLPTFILKQSQYSSAAGWASSGNIWAPLFFVEGAVNVLGFIVLAFVFGRALKKYIKPGDLVFGYVIWYGATRVFMEPLRYASFNMGADGMWSWIWGIIFVGFGILAIVINHFIRSIIENKKNEISIVKDELLIKRKNNFIALAILILVSVALVAMGVYLFVGYAAPVAPNSLIELVPHNIGLIALIVGCFFTTTISLPILKLININKLIAGN
ncbi:MAG: prolipoprotein diacylglyceryl transferase family protein [Erysipelotrichaceae bacterium]|nr:prolipoprotein diacylglyceryl transferase family protein [Erysipelotrichaceae bacterium]